MHEAYVQICNKMANAVISDESYDYSPSRYCSMNKESLLIKEFLRQLNLIGFLTTSSQPAVFNYKYHGQSFDRDFHSRRNQRAYVAGLMTPSLYEKLVTNTINNPFINIVTHSNKASLASSENMNEIDSFIETEVEWYGAMVNETYASFGLSQEMLDSLIIVMIQDKSLLHETYSCSSFWETLISVLK